MQNPSNAYVVPAPRANQGTIHNVFQGPTQKNRRRRRGSAGSSSNSSSPPSPSFSSPSHSTCPPAPVITASWGARRRDSRVNGADIYVARFTKQGVGSARPCWRCLEWCRWAGVKRVFHWNGEENRFEVVKVNNAFGEAYETHADGRLFSGLVSKSVKLRTPGDLISVSDILSRGC